MIVEAVDTREGMGRDECVEYVFTEDLVVVAAVVVVLRELFAVPTTDGNSISSSSSSSLPFSKSLSLSVE